MLSFSCTDSAFCAASLITTENGVGDPPSSLKYFPWTIFMSYTFAKSSSVPVTAALTPSSGEFPARYTTSSPILNCDDGEPVDNDTADIAVLLISSCFAVSIFLNPSTVQSLGA